MVPDWSDFATLSTAEQNSKGKKCMLFIVWLTLVLALARPQWIGAPIAMPESGRDLMLAVDLSGSMQTKDFKINGQTTDRLSALKVIVGDFIERRRGDRIGLILFGSQAYLQAPLTFDASTVKQLLMETAIGLAGQDTAMGDAIGLAVKQLKESLEDSRTLILVTDGNSNAGELSPLKGAEIAKHAGLKIYTIAIGSNTPQYQTFFGQKIPLPNVEIDEQTLKAIADNTGGHYFRAFNSDELAKIYHHIDKLEKQPQAEIHYRPTSELYYWPLGLGLLAIGLMMSSELFARRFG